MSCGSTQTKMFFICFCILSVILQSSFAAFSYSPRINGGQETELEKVPFMASLRELRGSQYKHICGATIVHMRYVLTAAQCLHSQQADWFSIAVGSNQKDDKSAENLGIKRIIVHEKYDAFVAPFKHDIALIELEQPLKLGDRIKVIPINGTFYDGEIDAIASGFGGVYVSLIELLVFVLQLNIQNGIHFLEQ